MQSGWRLLGNLADEPQVPPDVDLDFCRPADIKIKRDEGVLKKSFRYG